MKRLTVLVLAACLLLGGCAGKKTPGVSSEPEREAVFSVPEETGFASSSDVLSGGGASGASSRAASGSGASSRSAANSSGGRGAAVPRTSSQAAGSQSALPAVAHEITYGYNQLTAAGKALYDRMASAISVLEPVVTGFDPVSEETLKKVYYCVRADHPEFFWFPPQYSWQYDPSLRGDNIYTVKFTYVKPDKDGNPTGTVYTKAEVAAMKIKLEAAVKSMISGISASSSEFEKVRAVHDRIVRQTVYVKTPSAYSIYGALVERQAVCEGYSKAFLYLLSKVGVQSLVVRGVSTDSGEGHQWNIVRIGGEYTHIDVTFDDPDIPGKTENHVSYRYFGLTDGEIAQTHRVEGLNYTLPVCTSAANNYYSKRGLLFSDYDAAVLNTITAETSRAAGAGEASMSVRFATSAAYQKAYQALIKQERIFSVLKNAGGGINPNTYYLYQSGEFNILEIGFQY